MSLCILTRAAAPAGHLLISRAALLLQGLSYLKGIKQEQMENILDRFDAREERLQGDTVIKQGEMVKGGVCRTCGRNQTDADEHGALLGGGGTAACGLLQHVETAHEPIIWVECVLAQKWGRSGCE